jgi:ABC-type phosphate transport system auxiliary subunit
MARPTTAWIDEIEEASVIAKELFDSTIGFIRSDMADVKVEVREIRSRQQSLGDKLDAFREKMDKKFVAWGVRIDEKFSASGREMAERSVASEQRTNESFKQVDDRFTTLEKKLDANTVAIAALMGWQKATIALLALLVAMGGGLFTAMAKGFHWF